MKKLIIISLFFLGHSLFSQWKETSWQNTAGISEICKSGDTIVILCDKNILISTGNDDKWLSTGEIPDSFNIKVLGLFGSTLYAGGLLNLYTSSDFGASWVLRNNAFPATPSVTSLVNVGSTVYAGTNDGVFASTDNGVSWEQKNEGLDSFKNINAMLNFNDNILISTGHNIYLFDQKNDYWQIKKKGALEYFTFDKICHIDSNIFIGTFENTGSGGTNKIFLSTDSGESWTETNNLPYYKSYTYYMATSGKKLLISANDSLYISEDKGNTWTNATASLTDKLKMGIHGFYTDKGKLFAVSGSELYSSEDDGVSWKCIRSVLNYGSVYTLVSDGSRIFAGASPNKEMNSTQDGIFVSKNQGAKWEPSGLEGLDVLSLKLNVSDVYAITNLGNYKSKDYGASWGVLNEGFPGGAEVWSLDFMEGMAICAAGDKGVMTSTDGGNSWVTKNAGLPVPQQRVVSIKAHNNMLFAGLDSSFYMSEDSGESWVDRSDDLPDYFNMFWQIEARDTILYLLGRYGIYYSTDYGIYWNKISSALPSWDDQNYQHAYKCRIILSGGSIFAGIKGPNGGVFVTKDNGENWKESSFGMSDNKHDVSSFTISGDYIFAGTNSGRYGENGDRIYFAKISDFYTSVPEYLPLSNDLIISPNPSSDYIEISQPSESSKLSEGLSVRIFNVFGMEVNNPDPPFEKWGKENSSSQYSTKIDVSTFPPGLYFVRIGEKVGKFLKY